MKNRMTDADKALIDEITRGLRAEMRSHNDILILQLDQILTQTSKTNGRVDRLEDETGIGRWFERNPKRFFLIIILFGSLSIEGFTSIVEKIIKFL